MNAAHMRSDRAANPIAAALYGALVALVIAYGACYLFAGLGYGVVSGAGEPERHGPAALARASLNLYAVQHITLVGSGKLSSGLGEPERVTAEIALPVTLWAAIPAIALIIGGYAAARRRAPSDRWSAVLPAFLGGIIYAAVLAGFSRLLNVEIDSFVMPEFEGVTPHPPQVPFHPALKSTVIYGAGFGVVFTYLGALVALRGGRRDYGPGRWWASFKAVILVAAALQLLIMGGLYGWVVSKSDLDERSDGSSSRIAELLPAAAGMGYALIHGATLTSAAESRVPAMDLNRRLFYARVSPYGGTEREDRGEVTRKAFPLGALAAVMAVGGIAAIVMGFLAVRWGSRDGSIPTALRVALIHGAYLAALVGLCNMTLVYTDPTAVSRVSIELAYGRWILLSMAAVSALSLLGAMVAGGRR